MALTLRDLVSDDLPMLTRWRNAPHLRPFYVKPGERISEQGVRAKYAPRLAGASVVRSMIACRDDRPFGHLQWYLNRDLPAYGAAVIAREHGVSIDYFIGEPSMLGRGLGAAMLGALVVRTAPLVEAEDRVFYVGHDVENSRAIACSRRAGFREDGRYVEDARDCLLFVREEPS